MQRKRLFIYGCNCAALTLLTATTLAHAGAVFRCTGDGQTTFTNKPAGMSGCVAVTQYADPAPPPRHETASTPKAATPAAQLPLTARGTRGEYKSEPPSPFADVVSNVAVNGVQQNARRAQNATEVQDKNVEVRRGAVYKVARANGITEYTNVRPAGNQYQILFTYIATCFACNVHSAVDFATVALNLSAYRDEIATAASEFGLDPALLRAIIHAESAFNPNAISNKGAQGLMQLMPATASEMGVASPFDAAQNIRGGAHYLAALLKQFNGDERLAAAAYNSGPQNVQKFNGVPPFDETKVYVERVTTLRKRYGDAH